MSCHFLGACYNLSSAVTLRWKCKKGMFITVIYYVKRFRKLKNTNFTEIWMWHDVIEIKSIRQCIKKWHIFTSMSLIFSFRTCITFVSYGQVFRSTFVLRYIKLLNWLSQFFLNFNSKIFHYLLFLTVHIFIAVISSLCWMN